MDRMTRTSESKKWLNLKTCEQGETEMATKEVFQIVDRAELRKMNRSARRKALMATTGQRQYIPKVERNRTRYSRTTKHKGNFGD